MSETVPTAQPSPGATSATPLSCAGCSPDGYTGPSGTLVALHPLPVQCSAYGLVSTAVGGCPGLYPPTASTSAEDAAATPNSCPRAPAGALLVVPHATARDAAAAPPLASPAPHTAASTAAARPARLTFMASTPQREIPWSPPVLARPPSIRRRQTAVLPGGGRRPGEPCAATRLASRSPRHRRPSFWEPGRAGLRPSTRDVVCSTHPQVRRRAPGRPAPGSSGRPGRSRGERAGGRWCRGGRDSHGDPGQHRRGGQPRPGPAVVGCRCLAPAAFRGAPAVAARRRTGGHRVAVLQRFHRFAVTRTVAVAEQVTLAQPVAVAEPVAVAQPVAVAEQVALPQPVAEQVAFP